MFNSLQRKLNISAKYSSQYKVYIHTVDAETIYNYFSYPVSYFIAFKHIHFNFNTLSQYLD